MGCLGGLILLSFKLIIALVAIILLASFIPFALALLLVVIVVLLFGSLFL